jgi:4-amino-4-deoxy-L-arabinose transferase-like glycosyltransferase
VRARAAAFFASSTATWAIVGLALAIRLAFLILLARQPLFDDARDYHETALHLLHGDRFEPDWPPGLPYLLLPGYLVFGGTPLVARATMLILSLGFFALLYPLGLRLGDKKTANLALLAFAVFPAHVLMSVVPLTQLPTATALVAAALLADQLLERPRPGRALLLGLALAALLLLRPSNLVLCAALPLGLLAVSRRVSNLVLPLVVVLALVGLWSWKAQGMTGRRVFINNANSQNFYYGNNRYTPLYRTWWFGSHKEGEPGVPDAFVAEHTRLAHLPPIERDRAFSRAAMEHIKARPDLFVVRSLARLRTYFAFDTFTGAQLAKKGGHKLLGLAAIFADGFLYVNLVALALVLLCTDLARKQRTMILCAGLAFLYSGPYWISFAHPTYHFPIVPLLGVLAAHAAARWLGGETLVPVGLSRRRRVLVWLSLAALLIIQIEWALNMADRV